eukprot:918217-Rhodomonas_salina.2
MAVSGPGDVVAMCVTHTSLYVARRYSWHFLGCSTSLYVAGTPPHIVCEWLWHVQRRGVETEEVPIAGLPRSIARTVAGSA